MRAGCGQGGVAVGGGGADEGSALAFQPGVGVKAVGGAGDTEVERGGVAVAGQEAPGGEGADQAGGPGNEASGGGNGPGDSRRQNGGRGQQAGGPAPPADREEPESEADGALQHGGFEEQAAVRRGKAQVLTKTVQQGFR
jgi:hypothetical protein